MLAWRKAAHSDASQDERKKKKSFAHFRNLAHPPPIDMRSSAAHTAPNDHKAANRNWSSLSIITLAT
jgi:hypothetical protein